MSSVNGIKALIVHIARLPLYMTVLLMDIRRLRKARLLLMNGLRYKDSRIVGTQLQQQRRTILHNRNKLLVAYPRRIEKYIIAQMAYLIYYPACIGNGSVICSQLYRRKTERSFLLCPLRVYLGYLSSDIILFKAVIADAADEAARISRRFQIYRYTARLYQSRIVHRFMIIAVEQHKVSRRYDSLADYHIGSAGTVEHEIRMV